VSAKQAGSESVVNPCLLAIWQTTTVASYAFGLPSNGIVPLLTRRNSFFERRLAKIARTKCERSFRKKAIQPSAPATASATAKMQGTGWKKPRYREQTHESTRSP